MGSALVSFAPSAIHSVDEYLSALPELQRELKLGSTRFLKTVKVRATGCEYPLVAKVFVIHDDSLPLLYHKKNIDKIRNALENCPNALPFAKTIILEKSAILLRQYVKYSLYDRISTRPFLLPSEKKWIAFQLLCGLAQCHRAEVCHGDIKLNNILVTGWNWVVLTDFASFKPTLLPMDDPGDFSYFFDTSKGQVCCVAPERFFKERTPRVEALEESRGSLTPAMDIFSLGCVFIELFTDRGKSPFKLSDMYKFIEAKEEVLPAQLQDVEDEGVRELCAHMIQRDPKKRFSADEYLELARKKEIFPSCFYNGLLDYLKLYALDTAHPDSQISRLYKDHELFLQKIAGSEEGVLALVNFITSMLRSLKHSSAKMVALKLMKTCSKRLTPPVILDRLLPFMLNMLSDSCALVKAEAVHVLTDSLNHVQNVPKADAFVFVEYILPEIQRVSTDHNTIVRVALAANIGSLAESALRFLETSHLDFSETGKEDVGSFLLYRTSYERELEVLHNAMQNIVATLISDSCNQVKRMLLEKGATHLCIFFGQERAHDVLLSHMVTFLNDSSDHELRSSFFESVAGVAAFVGTTVTQILMPLIEQGFRDNHDAVVCSALKCITALTEVRFFRPATLCDLFKLARELLGHRNTWIRVEAAQFLACVARNVPLALKECRLRAYLLPYLECPVVQIEKADVIIALAKNLNVDSRAPNVQPRETEPCINLDGKKCKVISLKEDIPAALEESISDDELCGALTQHRQLQKLFEKKKKLAGQLKVETNDGHFSQAWKPKGTLMAHMHEHQGSINKICPMPDATFATCSSDGTVKLWDWSKVEKRTMTNKSCFTYSRLTGELVAMDYCHPERSLMIASNSGNMEVFCIASEGPRSIYSRCLDPIEDGWAVDIKPLNGSVMAYTTLHGGIHGWDPRMPEPPFKLKNDVLVGLMQCMAIDSSKSWLVTGSSEGIIVCWDLRFQLPITRFQHPFKCRVYNLVIPRCSSIGTVWASHLGNNEVSLWNLENQQRSKTLWASSSPPFNDRSFSRHVNYAICQADQYLFTGGTDMRIRGWDVSENAHSNSHLISGSAMDGDRIHATYTHKVCDGTEVIQEVLRKHPSSESKIETRMGSRAAAGHHDCISQLALIKTQRDFLISTSKDGVVKVWK